MEGDALMGPIETKVRGDVASLITAHPMGEALAEMAYSLARLLDEDGAGQTTAAVHRELRMNLESLAEMGAGDDDDLDAALSTPSAPEVRDPEEP